MLFKSLTNYQTTDLQSLCHNLLLIFKYSFKSLLNFEYSISVLVVYQNSKFFKKFYCLYIEKSKNKIIPKCFCIFLLKLDFEQALNY